jgi:hypothetical protein
VSNWFSIERVAPQTVQLIGTLAQIAAVWIASDAGYYLLLPLVGAKPDYNAASVAISLYYGFWIGIAIITFWPLYSNWPQYGRWTTFENRLVSYLIWSLSFVGCILFAAYALPSLPTISWTESWTPPDVRVATPLYFLPKSVEILFQQLLVVALVLALAAQDYSVRKIAIISALVFGCTHVLLMFGGVPLGYVLRFMISATAFGAIFPYLILRVPNGLAYSYMIHWLYYAASVVLPYIFSSPVK